MGDYHYFRLQCANDFLNCTAIQFSSKDHTNFWDVSTEKNQNVVTLFEKEPITAIDKSKIQKRLFKVLDDINPEVVILSGWDAVPSLLALLWAITYNIPTVIISESQSHDFKRTFLKELVKKFLLRLVDAAFVGGINQRTYLINLGFENMRIYEGCDIVDNDFFNQEIKESDLIKLNLPNQFFLTSCRFVEKKNLKTLIKAFSLLSDEYPDWSLVLAGDGPLRTDLENLVIDYDISDKVHFPGYLNYLDMKNAYAASSCFVLPSTTEQWGLVVNEALASGLPVICSENVGSAPNLLSKKHVGYTFNPYSSDDLKEKMISIIQELETQDFGTDSREVVSKWGREKYSRNIKKASEQAISVHKNRGAFTKMILRFFIYSFK